jgi:hypothetical protein
MTIMGNTSLLSDYVEWKLIINSLPDYCQDIYFEPEYLEMNSGKDSEKVVCFKYQEENKIWLFPVIKNPINKIGNYEINNLYDLETAYGYGGPISNNNDIDFLKKANLAFTNWAENSGIIALFVRFHPLINNQLWIVDDEMDILFDRLTVSMKTTTYQEIYGSYPKATKNILKRGSKSDIEIKLMDPKEDMKGFKDLYLKSMKYLNASQFYFFDDYYFSQLALLTEKQGLMIGAFLKGELISSAIFLTGTTWMHYHLSATDFLRRIPGLSNYVIDKAFQIACEIGISYVHLGGGKSTAEDDPLLKFKKSMSNVVHKFFIGKRIFNSKEYERVNNIWMEQYPELSKIYGDRLLCYRY